MFDPFCVISCVENGQKVFIWESRPQPNRIYLVTCLHCPDASWCKRRWTNAVSTKANGFVGWLVISKIFAPRSRLRVHKLICSLAFQVRAVIDGRFNSWCLKGDTYSSKTRLIGNGYNLEMDWLRCGYELGAYQQILLQNMRIDLQNVSIGNYLMLLDRKHTERRAYFCCRTPWAHTYIFILPRSRVKLPSRRL